jgi:protein-tyrosine phosphatase
LQVNLLSLTGYHGGNGAHAAQYLLDEGLAELVRNDLHHSRHLMAFQSQKNLTLFNRYVSNNNMINQTLLNENRN